MTLATSQQTEPFRFPAADAKPVHCFAVTAVADAGIMPRILEQWAKRGLMPDRWHSVRSASGEDVHMDIETSDMDVDLALQVSEAMRSIFGVSQVLMSKKGIVASSGATREE